MRLLTADEVAEQLRVPRSWVYAAARKGAIPSVPMPGGRYVRFAQDDLDAWVDQQRAATNGSRR